MLRMLQYESSREMGFLDISLTKDSCLLLHAIQSLLEDFKEKQNISLVSKSAKQENWSIFMNSIL
jgi:hypothetical protein